MPRIRSIKPEFWEDEEVALLSRDARLLYIACWNAADDEGLLRWTGPYLKSAAFIYDDDLTVKHVERLMSEIVAGSFVVPYSAGRSQQQLGWIPSFRKHQKPNRPQPSKFPPPSLTNDAVRLAYAEREGWDCAKCGDEILKATGGNPYESDYKDPSRGLSLDHIQPRSKGGSDFPSNIQALHKSCNSAKKDSWTGSVNDAGRPDAEPANPNPTQSELLTPVVVGVKEGIQEVERGIAPSPTARATDPLFDALVDVCGITPSELTPAARGAANKALKDLRSVGAQASELPARAAVFRSRWPDITLTPPALAKHWPTLDPERFVKQPKVSSGQAALLRAHARGGR